MQQYSALEVENNKNRRLLNEAGVNEQSVAARQEEQARMRASYQTQLDQVQ